MRTAVAAIREESRAPPVGLRLRVSEGHRNLPPIGYGHLEGASKSNFCPLLALSLSALRAGARAPAGRRQSKPPCGLARSRPGSQALLGKFADLRANATVGGDNAIPTCTRAFLHVHCRDEEVGDRARTWNTHVPRIPGIIRDFENWIRGGGRNKVILKIR